MADEVILVVDDEENILELLEYNLTRDGYKVCTATNGEDALESVRDETPDLIVLDLMLPGVDGLEICRTLKGEQATKDIPIVMLTAKGEQATKDIPIVMLTAKGEEADIVAGLELGADDYVTKPFSPRVLVARIRAVLRRRSQPVSDDASTVRAGELVINPGRHEVVVSGKAVDLTFTEFRILHFLARRPGWVFTRYQIVDGAQGEDAAVTDRSVDVHVVSLRRKLGSCGQYIETVRGVGYRFKDI